MVQLAVHSSYPDLQNKVNYWAQQLQLPIWNRKERADALLEVTDKGLQLRLIYEKAPGPMRVDFVHGALDYRRKHGGGRGQAIAKAVGLKKGEIPTVLDATAGLGTDAFVLASLGCRVTLLERSPIVAALLQDGLQRAATAEETAEIIGRMHFIQQDSNLYLQQLAAGEEPDVIYLDPMFPEKKKSAVPKKEMQILQYLLEDDSQDLESLFQLARQHAKNRVVIKRPVTAAMVGSYRPTFQLIGKSCRFDVYCQ